MSDCGVCLNFSGDECTGYRRVFVKAGKDWTCSECGKTIPRKSLYELASGFQADDGNAFWQAKTCLICAEIAEAFYCHGRYHGGVLWDSLYDCHDELNTSCLDRLTTPEAKAELQRRWMEWRGLTA